MLIRFNVKNFLSFNTTDEGQSVEFSMIGGKSSRKKEHFYDDEKIKLLKLATIYGANASGKSNLVKALNFTKKTVINGIFPDGHTNKYCKLLERNENAPSYFEFEIKIKDRYYSYGFEAILSKSEFISEWLIELSPNGKENIIFSRDIVNGEYCYNSEIRKSSDKKKFDIYMDDIKEDGSALFLKIMNQNKNSLYVDQKNQSINALKEVFKWIKLNLDVNYPDKPISGYNYLLESENVEEICRIISSFGTGITDFKMIDLEFSDVEKKLPQEFRKRLLSDIEGMSRIKKELEKGNKAAGNMIITARSDQHFFIFYIAKDGVSCKTIQFQHEKNNVFFDFAEESDGTRRILDLIEILISMDGKTFVIDELDRCLHPALTYRFIELFLKYAEKKNTQLIVTTHESRLLDFNLLRRDEIWFVNKKNTGESELYSLEEYNERFDKKIDKAYLEGRYGGVPIFNTLFPVFKEE